MALSQGTSTFLACFSAFWLVWALLVMLCCFCSFLQRRLKRRRDQRRREHCLRSVEMEPLAAGYPPAAPAPPPPLPPLPAPPAAVPLPLPAAAAPPPQHHQPPPREPPPFCPPMAMAPPVALQLPIPTPQATWVSMPDSDVFGKPPCYEEAVLMEDPPPPYSEVLADPRGGTYLKPAPLRALAPRPLPLRVDRHVAVPVFTCDTSKPAAAAMFPDRGYSSLIRLPSSQRWDSLGHLLSNMDLDHHQLPPPGPRSLQPAAAVATMPRREPRTQRHHALGLRAGIQGLRGGIQGLQGRMQAVPGLRGLEPPCGVPTAFPLLGRSTAV